MAPASGAPVAVTRQELTGLGRWPVKGSEKVLPFYFPLPDGIDLVRVLHGSVPFPEPQALLIGAASP